MHIDYEELEVVPPTPNYFFLFFSFEPLLGGRGGALFSFNFGLQLLLRPILGPSLNSPAIQFVTLWTAQSLVKIKPSLLSGEMSLLEILLHMNIKSVFSP